jgi:hypothetical protein
MGIESTWKEAVVAYSNLLSLNLSGRPTDGRRLLSRFKYPNFLLRTVKSGGQQQIISELFGPTSYTQHKRFLYLLTYLCTELRPS